MSGQEIFVTSRTICVIMPVCHCYNFLSGDAAKYCSCEDVDIHIKKKLCVISSQQFELYVMGAAWLER